MSSILIRTARGIGLPGSVIGNTSDSESDILSSNLSLVSKNVGFSLSGKVPHCECGEQGSSPGVNRIDMIFYKPAIVLPSSSVASHSCTFISLFSRRLSDIKVF
jgi:hypothetical protein